ncbi:MAG: hypothetical protein QOH01_3009 [Verrucomicrobiota bacterium]|jgi:hypothetical protein
MAFNISLWAVQNERLQPVTPTALDQEQRLEEWVAQDPTLLDLGILLIGRQVVTSNRGRIDLLGIDRNANLVVLEMKRDRTPREIVAQALDYASWVKDLSYDQIDAIARSFCAKSLADAFINHFGASIPTAVNTGHSIVILASQLDDSSERIVTYLTEEYGVPINVLFFTFFASHAGEFVARAWFKDPEELEERAQSRKQAPWSGYYFVNVGESPHRNWDDCRKYGFLTAGQGPRYSNAMKRLKEGDRVFAYLKSIGYVGLGTVISSASMVRDVVVGAAGEKLLEQPLKEPRLAENMSDPQMSEWAVRVNWQKTFSREEAKTFRGVFANQNVVCLLRDPDTVDFLEKQFGVKP